MSRRSPTVGRKVPRSAWVQDRRAILKQVPKLRKIKPAKGSMMRLRQSVAVGVLVLIAVAASAQFRRGDFIVLVGDTDDAIRLARVVKDIFGIDPNARRAVLLAREAMIQSWVEDKPATDLTEQERVAIRNPEYFDRPVIAAINVAFNVSPVTVALEWDVPPRFWPRLSAVIIPVANRVAREGALFSRKALRLVVKLQGAEMYRANAEADGSVTVVFQYD